MKNFVLKEVERCELPCAKCFWSGAALAVAAAGLVVAVAT